MPTLQQRRHAGGQRGGPRRLDSSNQGENKIDFFSIKKHFSRGRFCRSLWENYRASLGIRRGEEEAGLMKEISFAGTVVANWLDRL